ncbi:MAG: DsbA family protein [Pseudomonadota bacterium]
MAEGRDEPRDEDAPTLTRRALTLGGVGLAAFALLQAPRAWQRWTAGEFEFIPLEAPAGFRLLSAGAITAGRGAGAALAVLPPDRGADDLGSARAAAAAETARAQVRADPCGALFGGARVPEGVVPIASFSDYNCPYCRVLTKVLAGMEAESGGTVRVRWHEWPLFGEVSEVYARAAIAADKQGAYPQMHARLMRTRFVPNAEYLHRVAEESGLNGARLLSDLHAPETEARIAQARALAGLFGFPGTPALVVGRTAVIGAIPEASLAALIARERVEGPPPGCA